MHKTGLDLVSVVIPVYNAEKYIEETLASVWAQTYPHLEVVVVDDGSTDRSLKILEQFSDRIVLVRQKNAGAAAARNAGVQAARGRWIAFLDSDDVWHPEKVARQLASCGNRKWSYTDTQFMGGINDGKRDSDLNTKHAGMVLKELITNNFIGTSGVMIQRQCFLEAGGFDKSLRSIEDWDLWIRLASRYEIAYADEPLVQYRIHPASQSRSSRKTLPDHIRVIEKCLSPGGPAAQYQHLMPVAKSKSYGICSQIAEEEGDFAYAMLCALQACLHNPRQVGNWYSSLKSVARCMLSMVGLRQQPMLMVIFSNATLVVH